MKRFIQIYIESFRGLPRNIWSLSIVLLINRTGAMVLPFLSVYLTKELGVTLEQAAAVVPFYGMGSMAGAYIGGQLTNRIGAYLTQVASLVLSGLVLLMLMEAHSLVTFTAWLFVTSMVMDMFRPANMASIGEYAPKELRTKSVGLIRLAVNLGYSLGPVAAGFIAGFLSYRWLFAVDAVTCWMAAGIFLLLLKKPSKMIMTQEEEDKISTGSPYTDRRYMYFIGLCLITGVVFVQLIYTMPVFYEKELGLLEHQIGPMLALNALVVAIMEMPLIHVLQHRLSPIKLLYLGAAMMGLCYLIYAGTTSVPLILVGVVIFSFGELLNLPFAASVILDISPEQRRGAYMGVFTMVWSICMLVGPWIGFKLAAWLGFSGLWLVMAGLSAVAVVLYWYFERHYRLVAPG